MKTLSRYSQAPLPTRLGNFQIVVYRLGGDPNDEHLAMVLGEISEQSGVLCRVHSECLTGEVLGSLRCDCREQLNLALSRIAEAGSGVLVYLRQEGRGIGLGNKIRAYALQDEGADTVDANLALGFDADQRSYEIAAAMLGDLGVPSVRLMTNNPAKVAGLASCGIDVVDRVAHWVQANAENADYLRVKQNRMGHMADPEPGQTPGPVSGQPIRKTNSHKDASGT
ncbi:MAG: GTP cyclohydrolase II [Myxococcota bacterium]